VNENGHYVMVSAKKSLLRKVLYFTECVNQEIKEQNSLCAGLAPLNEKGKAVAQLRTTERPNGGNTS